jgi:hypothetical protein
MTVGSGVRAHAHADRIAGIDWQRPACDPPGIVAAYRHWQAMIGLDRPIRVVSDPAEAAAVFLADRATWPVANGASAQYWTDLAGSSLLQVSSGLLFPRAPALPPLNAAWDVAVAWACGIAWGSLWRALSTDNTTDPELGALFAAALGAMAECPTRVRAVALIGGPTFGLCDAPPRIARITRDILEACRNDVLWQMLARMSRAYDGLFASYRGIPAEALGPPRPEPIVEALVALSEPMLAACESGAFAHAFVDGETVVVAAPSIATDGRRLHCADGPALAWRQTKIYAWKGVVVPESVILQPPTFAADAVRAEQDERLQHALIDIYAHTHGHPRAMRDLGGIMLHEDETGRLWSVNPRRRPLADQPGELRLVEVVNGTAEPDGSRKIYWLRVPPDMQTAQQAVAWTYGLTPKEYGALAVRT